MNTQSDALNQRLTLMTKNGSIHLGLVEEQTVSPPSTDAIQLELDFNQVITDYH